LWAFYTLLFPEFILTHAILERQMAFRGFDSVKDFVAPGRPRNWYQACWDFVKNVARCSSRSKTADPVEIDDLEQSAATRTSSVVEEGPENSETSPNPYSSKPSWTLKHSYYVNMGGLRLRGHLKKYEDGNAQDGAPTETLDIPITCRQLYVLLFPKFIPSPPKIKLDSIEDRSKSDSLAKTITLIQVLWLALSVLTRASRKLAISQLEIAALAFAACTVVTYLFYWEKPQDVMTFTTLESVEVPENIIAGLRNSQSDRMVQHLLHTGKDWKFALMRRVPNDNFDLTSSAWQPLNLILAIATVSGIQETSSHRFWSTNPNSGLFRCRSSRCLELSLPISNRTQSLADMCVHLNCHSISISPLSI
jgi:hypothetical protein